MLVEVVTSYNQGFFFWFFFKSFSFTSSTFIISGKIIVSIIHDII